MKKRYNISEKNLKLTTLGFTLIELMATIVIISIVVILTFPNIVNQIKKSKDANKENVNSIVISAAKKYVNDHPNKFEENGSDYCIMIKDLVDNDYLKEDVVNDKNYNIIDHLISVKFNNNFTYKITEKCVKDYNQIGLVLRLDGILNSFNKETNNAVHKDNIKSWDNIVKSDVVVNLGWKGVMSNTDNHYNITLRSWWYISSEKDLRKLSNYTIEFVGIYSNYAVADTFSEYNGNFSLKGNGQLYVKGKTVGTAFDNLELPRYQTVTVDSNGIKWYIDGELMSTTSDQFVLNDDDHEIRIGAKFYSDLGSGDMYAIRIYDRSLSNSEIKYNYEIDKQRFNLE